MVLFGVVCFVLTLIKIKIWALAAPRLGLIDMPSPRKRHEGPIPVVGGIAVFTATLVSIGMWTFFHIGDLSSDQQTTLLVFFGCAGFLVISGALDDRFHTGVAARIFSEILVALTVVETLGLQLSFVGDLIGLGTIKLPPVYAYPFTVLIICAVINCFNMLDGIDGLVTTLVISSTCLFYFMTMVPMHPIAFFIICSLLAFLVSNLRLSPLVPHTFLGDAGSKLIGFTVVCFLLTAASAQVGSFKIIQPVTALFIIAIPLCDMVFLIIWRLIRKGSPFSSDRNHIHHLLQRSGLSDLRSLVVITATNTFIGFIGLLFHKMGVQEYFQFSAFLAFFGLYCLLVSQAWRVVESTSK